MTLGQGIKQIRAEIEDMQSCIEVAEEWHIRYIKRVNKSAKNIDYLKSKKFELERELHILQTEMQSKLVDTKDAN